jgi:hypothetical protein
MLGCVGFGNPTRAWLSWQHSIGFRRVVAVVCMALAVVLSGQAYISLMDRVEHAHHHVHFANPLAGDLQIGHHHDHGMEHASHHHDDPQGAAEHQHGDATIMFLAAQSFVLTACPIAADRCVSVPMKFASINPRGPDRPPKALFEIRV